MPPTHAAELLDGLPSPRFLLLRPLDSEPPVSLDPALGIRYTHSSQSTG